MNEVSAFGVVHKADSFDRVGIERIILSPRDGMRTTTVNTPVAPKGKWYDTARLVPKNPKKAAAIGAGAIGAAAIGGTGIAAAKKRKKR